MMPVLCDDVVVEVAMAQHLSDPGDTLAVSTILDVFGTRTIWLGAASRFGFACTTRREFLEAYMTEYGKQRRAARLYASSTLRPFLEPGVQILMGEITDRPNRMPETVTMIPEQRDQTSFLSHPTIGPRLMRKRKRNRDIPYELYEVTRVIDSESNERIMRDYMTHMYWGCTGVQMAAVKRVKSSAEPLTSSHFPADDRLVCLRHEDYYHLMVAPLGARATYGA